MRRYCAIVCGFWSLVCASALYSAQPATPKWSDLDQAIGKEDYATSLQVANSISQRGTPDDKRKAAQVYARVLLALGQKEQARKYLNQMAKPGNDATGGQQTKIYKAWLLALDGKSDEAVKSLEKMLESNPHGDTTAESADVLAMFFMASGDMEKAKKAVDFGLQVLQYKGVKDGYVLALLRGRLTSNFTAGWAKRMYDEAEKLRAENKFAEAGQLFAQVRAMYPKSEWAHASGFRIGQCFLGMNQSTKAVDWWQKFIKDSSAGPWRGQSYVALIDTILESELNLKKATEFAMTATATLSKGLGKDAEPSWKEAAYDIHLRLGIVSLVDGRFDAAKQALENAKKAGGNPALLDRLIEAAKQQSKLVPDELGIGDDRAKIALAIGTIDNVLCQYDRAKVFFTLPLNGSMRSRSAPHRSFAGLGFARVLVATGGIVSTNTPATSKKVKVKEAVVPNPTPFLPVVAAYEACLKEYPGGSWHEETLREIALLIERVAAEQYAPPVVKQEVGPKGEKKPTPPISDQARLQLKKATIAARTKALPYWVDLRQRYPTSRHVPQALYHSGVLFAEAEKPEEALAAFDELIKKHPYSPWTGDAQVKLIDVKLEHQFDLAGAMVLAEAAVDWYEHIDQARTAQARSIVLSFWNKTGLENSSGTLRSVRQVGYEIYIRAGLVEYLKVRGEGKARNETPDSPEQSSASAKSYPRTLAFFEKAKPLQPERNFVVVQGHIPTGIERLIKVAETGRSLTPEIVCKENEQVGLVLQFADLQLEANQCNKAIELYDLVIYPTRFRVTAHQKSWAHHQKATAIYAIPDCKNAYNDFVQAQLSCPGAPWAARSLFQAACITNNFFEDKAKAATQFMVVVKRYPNSDVASKAAYFAGVTTEWDKQLDNAKVAYQWYLKKYPGSQWAELVKTQHLPEVEKQLKAVKESPKTRTEQ